MKTKPFALGFVWALIWQLVLTLGPNLAFIEKFRPSFGIS